MKVNPNKEHLYYIKIKKNTSRQANKLHCLSLFFFYKSHKIAPELNNFYNVELAARH